MEKKTLYYASEVLDRNPDYRNTSLAELKAHPNDQVIPIWRSRNLFELSEQEVRVVHFSTDQFNAQDQEWLFLGMKDEAPVFALDFSSHELEALPWLEEKHQFEEVRRVFTNLSKEEASLLAYARGMMTWHRNHQFCGKCGSPTLPQSNGHERKCTNSACGKVAYPRVDPAVIVLIEHRFDDGIERCLLGRSNRYPEVMYSTLAGFVEPGESLEMTVRREMMEEVGLEVDNIHYIASQPWPFPTSLMLGFYATASHTHIRLDTNEVAEAKWFSRQELKEKSASGEINLSRIDSIANHLITNWISNT